MPRPTPPAPPASAFGRRARRHGAVPVASRWVVGAAALTVSVLPAMLPVPATAEPSPYSLGASLTVLHDSNLLRLGDNQALPAGYARSDTVTSAALVGSLDQPIGRQRLRGSATLNDNRMSHNSIYDNQGYGVNAELDWETIERLSGSITLERTRSLASFASFDQGVIAERNVQTTQRAGLVVRHGLPDRLQLELGLDHQSVDYSATAYDRFDLRQSSVRLGVRYRPSAALGFGASVRRLDGRYPRAFVQPGGGDDASDDVRRTSLDLSADWQPSGASHLYARLSPMRVRYDLATSRDYSGLTGALTWDWVPGARLRLTTDLVREPAQDSLLFAAGGSLGSIDFSRITTGMRLKARYEMSAKVQLQVGLAYNRRQLDNTLVLAAVNPATVSATDNGTAFDLGLTWQPTRTIALGCAWRDERRSGSALSLAMRYRTASCNAQLAMN